MFESYMVMSLVSRLWPVERKGDVPDGAEVSPQPKVPFDVFFGPIGLRNLDPFASDWNSTRASELAGPPLRPTLVEILDTDVPIT
jgi:hypothetical protein